MQKEFIHCASGIVSLLCAIDTGSLAAEALAKAAPGVLI